MISNHFGASGRSSLLDLCSIFTVFSVSILVRLPTIYTGIFECHADNAIEKLQTLLYISPLIFIASEPIITISMSTSDSYTLSTKNGAESSTTMVFFIPAFIKSLDVVLH